MSYNFQIETDREEDGRWIAEIPELPGVLAYGASREYAIRSVEALALRVLADKLEASKEKPLNPFAVTMASPIE
jgi:predicted RNase H-like HicB family nuclease